MKPSKSSHEEEEVDETEVSSRKKSPRSIVIMALRSPVCLDFISPFLMKRRFRTAHPELNDNCFWELEVNGSWKGLENTNPGYERQQYVKTYRLGRIVFNQLYGRYGAHFEKQKQAIP